MPDFNIFSLSSASLNDWILKNSIPFDLPMSSKFIVEGQPLDSIYIVEHGTVDVLTTDTNGNQSCLASLGHGSLFGEMSWLEQSLPVATVCTQTPSRLFRLPLIHIDSLQESNITLAAELMYIIAQKLSLQITAQNEWVFRFADSSRHTESIRKVLIMFSILEEEDVYQIASHGRLHRYKDSETVIQQGESLSHIHLVMAGDLDIYLDIDGVSKKVGSSRRGEILGEMSFLSNHNSKASATVISNGSVELLQIETLPFLDYLNSNQEFRYRLYKSLACMLSQRSRDQLYENNLSLLSKKQITKDDDELDFGMIATLNRSGQLFSWLCDKFQSTPIQ